MVIEYARSVLGLTEASSTEFEPQTKDPVIAALSEQQELLDAHGDLGGTMRLGSWPAVLAQDSVVAGLYGTQEITERHRHRYEVNGAYRQRLEEAGLRVSGTSPDGGLVEFVELPADVHPFYVATQAHPELRSRPLRPHPLFAGLVDAALERADA
jgi:CTP synthase